MRSRRSPLLAALLLSSVGVLFSLPASAQEATPPPKDAPRAEGEGSDFKRVALAINPLAIGIGRYSIQGEYLPLPHHAITLNPFFAHVPVTVSINGQDVDAGSLNGFGGELGYRFYTGSKGASGFFVGPSLLFASYSQSAGDTGASQPKSSDSFLSYGAALDIGGQAVIGPGIVVGGGFGLQYTKTSEDINTDNLNLASSVVAGGGVRPRFLFALGYSF
ncbi:hypothetical protein LVJ94_02535 [Pendulispora rubella]|uniref:Outer membrane protein beta-barrel domain-containing protein n=1 Tax=Pendulispora rubella TaxID=2741070 RepID=A0ABZ2L5T4_9BACT